MMRRTYYIFILLLQGLLLTSCEFETSDNGKLDGYWQLAQIDTLQGGSADVTASRQFWSVQMHLLQVEDHHYLLPAYLFRFEHRGDSLRLYNPHLVDRAGADKPITDASLLRPYAIQRLEQHYLIEQLNDNRLVLRSDSLRLFFNRY